MNKVIIDEKVLYSVATHLLSQVLTYLQFRDKEVKLNFREHEECGGMDKSLLI